MLSRLLTVCLIMAPSGLFSQALFEETAPSRYRIVFTDKLNSPYTTDVPEMFLSFRAIERRLKQIIPVTQNDLPVNPAYLDSLREAGGQIIHSSKWFNSATIRVTEESVLERISKLTFVAEYVPDAPNLTISKAPGLTASNTQSVNGITEMDYGGSWFQTAMHKGQLLHNNGYTGKNMVIAIIDAGFAHADTLSAFNNLFERGQIIGTRDFVEPGNNVYGESSHGMSVLSIIGGYRSGELIGTAPDASFWLLRSEDGNSEYIIEEDNWIAAAEFADSAGADIINTSLGYSEFNDSSQNHTYTDMDGNTTRVSRAADIAASKGILVVTSAGNQGNVDWKYITAPADADSVLTIGAVDRLLNVTAFSSRGPSSDGQVKPNVMALGAGVFVAGLDGSIRQGNGTSFSSPVITGLSACLWQANPEATMMEIYNAICESADRYYNPDSAYGYGIPDFNLANILLKAAREGNQSNASVMAFPNPFYNQLYIFFETPVNSPVDITLFDLAGKEVFRKNYPAVYERKHLIVESDFDHIQKGVYIIRIVAKPLSGNAKLVKY